MNPEKFLQNTVHTQFNYHTLPSLLLNRFGLRHVRLLARSFYKRLFENLDILTWLYNFIIENYHLKIKTTEYKVLRRN